MNRVYNLNNFLYHSLEVLLCDVKIAFLEMRIASRNRRIARLETLIAKA